METIKVNKTKDWRKTLKKAMSVFDLQGIPEQKGIANKIRKTSIFNRLIILLNK